MTRGNQREVDRARAQARNAKAKKNDNHTSQNAKLEAQMNSAEIMREKQKQSELKKAALEAEGMEPKENMPQEEKKEQIEEEKKEYIPGEPKMSEKQKKTKNKLLASLIAKKD